MSNNKGEQLNLDFADDNMAASCPTIIIDSIADKIQLDDTIDFDFTHTGLTQNQLDVNWPYTSLGGATITGAVGNMNPWLTTNGTGGYTITTNGTGNISPGLTFSQNDFWNSITKSPGLSVKGDAEFDGDVKIKGKSISETLEKIEQRLAILHPNEKLEASWEKLKELGDAYRAMEKEILEAEKMWDILKK